jgi:hypothetical protein
MSAKIIRMIPPEERPYEWARKEMEKYFPNPDRFRLTNLDKRTDEPNTQVSLFRKGAEDPVILRVYWFDTNSVKYSIIVNYDELYAEYPVLVDQLFRNGIAAYEAFEKADPHYVNSILYGRQ